MGLALMALRSGSARIDLFVVADAVLISLACALVMLAYHEISATPGRNAQSLAETVAAIAMQDGATDAVGDKEPLSSLEERINNQRLRILDLGVDASTSFFSDQPGLRPLTDSRSDFIKRAWSAFAAGKTEPISISDAVDGASVHRAAIPIYAAADCGDCIARGVPAYHRGELVGVREFRVPHSDAFRQTIRQLLYAIAILATALMCVLGIIFPVIKRHREDGARMQDLTSDLERVAKTDPLTGLANRRHFDFALNAFFEEFNKIDSPVSLLLFDIDHFKQINDSQGHNAGDAVLRQVAEKLRHITRSHDVVARIGGDEFAVITPYLSEHDMLSVAERYRSEINNLRVNVGGAVLRPTISVGVAAAKTDPASLFKAADERLYEAKNRGRNRIAA